MKDGQVLMILPEMMHEPYNLEDNLLLVYAALFALSAKQPFKGTYQNLASWIEIISARTVNRAIDELVKRKLVRREIVSPTNNRFEGVYLLEALCLPNAAIQRYRYIKVGGHSDEFPRHGDESARHGDEHNNTIYNNTIFNKKENKKENKYYRSAPYEVTPEVLALEEQMREQRRREREQADREASTPEALAARDAFFAKFCKKDV